MSLYIHELYLYIYLGCQLNLKHIIDFRDATTLTLIPWPISTPPWVMLIEPSLRYIDTMADRLTMVPNGNFIGTKLMPLFFQTLRYKILRN